MSENCKEGVQDCLRCLDSVDDLDGSDICLVKEVDHALREIKKGTKLSHSTLVHLAEKLGLKSNQEILKEASVLEKQKNLSQMITNKNEELLNLLIVLVSQMSNALVQQKTLQAQEEGISIPVHFRCPLSLELMSDPVIIESGLTYERANIQQWLDEGNTTCPQSRQILNHFHLTNNISIKVFIAKWCEQNGVSLPIQSKIPTHTQSTFLRMSDGPTENGTDLQNIEASVTAPHAGESVQSIARCQGICESGREIGAQGSSVESKGVLSWGRLRAAILELQKRRSLLSLAGESCRDGMTSFSRHSSDPCHGWSSNNTSTELDAKRSISLQNNLWGDASENLALLTFPSASTSSHVEDYTSDEHDLVSMGHDAAKTGPNLHPNVQSDTRMESDGDDMLVKVQGLVRELRSTESEVQRNAVKELRLLAKVNVKNRITMADLGAIPPLISLLHSTDPEIQVNAVTALLNLSINNDNKSEIACASGIGPLIHVLSVGTLKEARENAAATLSRLCMEKKYQTIIGQSGAIDPLVDLLTNGTQQGRKDAVTALFDLSACQENRSRIVRANAVRPLVGIMSDPAAGMIDKAVSVIANLSTIPEGASIIDREEGIPVLVDALEVGSQRGKQNAVIALHNLCKASHRFRSKVWQEGVFPPLFALTQSGTESAKTKASALLRLFRE